MSEKKTIQFNPELLKFANNNKTRKARPASSQDGIKLRAPRKKDETFKKNSILKMIRKHQQEKYNKMLESFESPNVKSAAETQQQFKSDFEDSKQFMDKLLEDSALKINTHNSTVRREHSGPSLLYNLPLENIFETNDIKPPTETFHISPPTQLNQPRYGCLKNGALPTYKQWLNATQKMQPSSVINKPVQDTVLPVERNAALMRASEMKQRMDLNARPQAKRRQKQKRIIRRTFKIGKSQVIPKVAVLISNRSIRNKVSTDSQMLKQKPIEEIKKELIKRGLIRVGTTAPNDVLRKMYECSVMMCGEVQNHNPENLLYNFLNSEAS